MTLTSAQAPVQQTTSNAQDHAHDVCNPVVDFGAAVEAGLDEFNGTAEGTRANENRQETKAARAREREGECGKGDEVHELVAAIRRRGRRLRGPEHRDTQGERHNYGEGDVEVLAHTIGLTALVAEHKEKLLLGVIRVLGESGAKSGSWGFR